MVWERFWWPYGISFGADGVEALWLKKNGKAELQEPFWWGVTLMG